MGLDPDPARLWPAVGEGSGEAGGNAPASPAAQAAAAVGEHCRAVLTAVAPECVGVKFQLACFERLGAPGRQLLGELVAKAAALGLLTIADAKRGDIDVSARAYAESLIGETPSPFGPLPGLGADAVTVSPLLGRDSLTPFVEVARSHGRGVFVLVRTSNPGAAELQDQVLRDGGTLSVRLARIVAELGEGGVGQTGLADVGAVVGATAPERMRELRELMPRAPFLLPGVGAQGGRVEDLAAAFAPGPAGGLVTASRGIVSAWERDGADPAGAARREAARLRELAWVLGRGA